MSQKISELDRLQSGYIQSSYLEFPVLHAQTNKRLAYEDLKTQLQSDGVGGAPLSMFKLTSQGSGQGQVGVKYTAWVVETLLNNGAASYDTEGQTFQLSDHGIYKISIVASIRMTDSYGNGSQNWAQGTSEFGNYVDPGDSYYPAQMIPTYGYVTSHNRYLPNSDGAYTSRPYQMWTDEFFIDFRDTNLDDRYGKFNIGSFVTGNNNDTPWFRLAMTVTRVG